MNFDISGTRLKAGRYCWYLHSFCSASVLQENQNSPHTLHQTERLKNNFELASEMKSNVSPHPTLPKQITWLSLVEPSHMQIAQRHINWRRRAWWELESGLNNCLIRAVKREDYQHKLKSNKEGLKGRVFCFPEIGSKLFFDFAAERNSVLSTQQWQCKAHGKASRCLRHTSHNHSVGAFKKSTSFITVFCGFCFSRKFSSVMTRITQEPLTATRCATQSKMQVLSPVQCPQLKGPSFVLVHHRVTSLNTVLPFKDRS